MNALLVAAVFAGPPAAALAAEASDVAEAGRAVVAVERLLACRLPADPAGPDAERVKRLRRGAVAAGQLTRMYPWVRSRLDLELRLIAATLRDTRPDPAGAAELRARDAFLTRLRREIDAPR